MDVTESYRVLELEIGAARGEMDAAYCRLVERWHPDRAAACGPDAVREAKRRVQEINEAYHTLAKIAPNSKNASPFLTSSASSGGGLKIKPKILPLTGGEPSLGHAPPPPPPPPADSWAARSGSAASPLSTPESASFPPPGITPSPSGRASDPATQAASTPPKPPSEPRGTVKPFYEPPSADESPLRRFGPAILSVATIILVLFFLGKYTFSSTGSGSKNSRSSAVDPKTTGRLMVKSNLANVTIEAKRLPSPGDATSASITGSIDESLSGLPAGTYAVTARAEGWPEVHGEATVEVEQTTEVVLNFTGGSLRLDSDPTGATVRQGAAVLGRTPLVIPNLPPGECQLALEYPSWPVASFKTTIAGGAESTGMVRLPQGKLIMDTTPTGTTVLMDGRALGQTPLTVEQFPAGTKKLALQAADFPPLEISVTLEDRGELKIHPTLGSVFPGLDPAALLRAVWVPDDPDKIAPPLDGVTGRFQSRNGIVKNLNRKWLFENWMSKRYCFTGIVKSLDPVSGQIEFVEQSSDLSRYRILAILSAGARSDPDLLAQLTKGASFTFYGRLSAVEEPRWPSKVITFEFSPADPLR